MAEMTAYHATRDRVEDYFDRTATRTWEALTSDVPVSRVRETVRAGRDQMRAMMLSRLPHDLRGARVLDAGCGAGQLTAELAMRGADVLAVDLSPKMIEIARARLPRSVAQRVRFVAGDMLSDGLGRFDAAMAMDSLIYYRAPDLVDAIDRLSARTDRLVFTLAPRTPALTAMWWAGQLFPRGDKSPTIIPHSLKRLRTRREIDWVGRVNRGFYISDCVKVQR